MRANRCRYLIDEDTAHALRSGILRRQPEMEVRVVGGDFAPPKGIKDPSILDFIEQEGYILITSNRNTMPRHLMEHLQAGKHVPGIFMIRRGFSYGAIINELEQIWLSGTQAVYRDRITHIPLQ